MISLLIVDDEKDILDGLKNTIRWRLLGISSVYTAQNGLEALGVLEKNHVDIILTDVRMPGMDGIELSRNVVQRFPKMKLIILSGYSEFEYAKSAMEFGAVKYLLKPVNIRELLETVHKIKKDIIRENEVENRNDRIQSEFRLLQEKFLLDLIENRIIDNVEICEGKKKYQISSFKAQYILILLKIKSLNGGELPEDIGVLAADFFRSIFYAEDEYKFLIRMPNNELCLICNMKGDDRDLSTVLTVCKEQAKNKFNTEVKIGISDKFHSLENLSSAFNQAKSMLKLSFVEEQCDIFFYIEQSLIDINNGNKGSLKTFISELYKDGEAPNDAFIESFFKKIRRDAILNEDDIKSLCRSLVDLILQSCIEKNTYSMVYDKYLRLQVDMLTVDRISKLKDLIMAFYAHIKVIEADLMGGSRNRMVNEIKEYIRSNYNKEIDINNLAAIINRSPNYLSHLFNEISGEGIIEYLNKVRIEEAKKLLKMTDSTLYCIAKVVGYSDEKYLIKMFKKYTSSTPTQYRNMITGSEVIK